MKKNGTKHSINEQFTITNNTPFFERIAKRNLHRYSLSNATKSRHLIFHSNVFTSSSTQKFMPTITTALPFSLKASA